MRKRLFRPDEEGFFHNYRHDPVVPPLRVVATGISWWKSGEAIRRKHSRTFSVNLVTKGSACFEQNGEQYLVKKGEVFLPQKSGSCSFSTGPEGILNKRFMVIDGPALDVILHTTGLHQVDYLPGVSERVSQILRSCHDIMRRKEENFAIRLAKESLELLLVLAGGLSSQYPKEILKTVAYIRQNLRRRFTLADISDRMGRSVRHCSRLFRTHFGASPMEYVVQQKMAWAEGLLSNSPMSIGEIANIVGYEDAFHFSVQFKRHLGVSPREFRKGKA